jgi:hypothetical protein
MFVKRAENRRTTLNSDEFGAGGRWREELGSFSRPRLPVCKILTLFIRRHFEFSTSPIETFVL